MIGCKQLVIVFAFNLFVSNVKLSLIENNNRLSVKLLNVLPQNENNFYSPLSLTYSLYMLLNGADGQTRTELNDLFGIDQRESIESISADVRPTLDSILAKNSELSKVKFANRILVSDDYDLKVNYTNLIKDKFNTTVEEVDFDLNSAKITNDINRWVSEQTNGKIERLFESNFDNDTNLVISNALYFSSQWYYMFDNESTTKQPFYSSDGNITSVPMMFQMRRLKQIRSEELNSRLVELPFEDNMSMIIILPGNGYRLNQVIQNLTHEVLSSTLDKLSNVTKSQTLMYLPKFQMDTEYNLKSPLKQLGLKTLIDGPADLTGIIGAQNIRISEAIHKAVFKVTEVGAEASAAFAMVGVPTIWLPPVEFRVDRPFLFLIRDMGSGLVYFMGQVNSIQQ